MFQYIFKVPVNSIGQYGKSVAGCCAFVVVMVGRREDDGWKHFHRTQYGKGFKANCQVFLYKEYIRSPIVDC